MLYINGSLEFCPAQRMSKGLDLWLWNIYGIVWHRYHVESAAYVSSRSYLETEQRASITHAACIHIIYLVEI